MSQKEKACHIDDRLGKMVLPDKEAVDKSLNDFKNNVKSKEETELVVNMFFEQMRRLRMKG